MVVSSCLHLVMTPRMLYIPTHAIRVAHPNFITAVYAVREGFRRLAIQQE